MSKNADKAAAKRRAAKKHQREVNRSRAKRTAGAMGGGPGILLDSRLPEDEKLSNRVMEVARPFLLECSIDIDRSNLISFAVFAWNQGADPTLDAGGALRAGMPEQVEADPEAYQDALLLMDLLVKRKQELYPRDRRVIEDFEVSVSGKEVSLVVVHAPDVFGRWPAAR
jgi:hypothetical protein